MARAPVCGACGTIPRGSGNEPANGAVWGIDFAGALVGCGGPVGNFHPLQAVERVGPLAVFRAIIHTENGAPRWRRVTALRRLLRAQTFLSSAV